MSIIRKFSKRVKKTIKRRVPRIHDVTGDLEHLHGFLKRISNTEGPFEPDWDGVVEWSAKSRDGCRIHGWKWTPANPRATLILCHGLSEHAWGRSIRKVAKWAASKGEYALAAVNFRFHGPNSRKPEYASTVGEAERWDLTAAIDKLEARGAQTPYILIGYSMGAMAASRVLQSDKRVIGGFLISPPCKPRHAMRCEVAHSALAWAISRAIDRVYASRRGSITERGYVRNHNMNPSHRPFLCYWMGERDKHQWKETFCLYKRWYSRKDGADLNQLPEQAPDRRKWFILGKSHHVLKTEDWKDCLVALESFLRVVLR